MLDQESFDRSKPLSTDPTRLGVVIKIGDVVSNLETVLRQLASYRSKESKILFTLL
jgi:hypothetical protein